MLAHGRWSRRGIAWCGVAALAVSLAGCGAFVEPRALSVGPPVLDFAARLAELSFGVQPSGVEASGMDWRVTGIPSWATVTPSRGWGGCVVRVTIQRAGCGSGEHEADLRVEGPAGSQVVHLRMFVGGG